LSAHPYLKLLRDLIWGMKFLHYLASSHAKQAPSFVNLSDCINTAMAAGWWIQLQFHCFVSAKQ